MLSEVMASQSYIHSHGFISLTHAKVHTRSHASLYDVLLRDGLGDTAVWSADIEFQVDTQGALVLLLLTAYHFTFKRPS